MADNTRGSNENQQPYPFMYFTSVNRRVDPYLMKDEELWDLVNFWTERRLGAKKVRPGLTPFLNAVDSSPVKGLFYVKFPSGQLRLCRMSGGKFYAVDPTTAANWGTADLDAGAITFKRPEYTVLAGVAHIVDRLTDTDSRYWEWTNPSGTDVIAQKSISFAGPDPVVPYQFRTITTFHRRVYGAGGWDGTNLFKSMLAWSSIDYVNKGTTPSSPYTTEATLIDTTKASSRHVDRDYKGEILKITNINDRINIYKEEGIYRYNEASVFDIFGLSPIDGSIATLQETKEDFFLTNEGFFKTNGKETKPIGDGWYDIIKQIFNNGITTTKIHSFAINFLYFCYVGDVSYDGQTIANACFVYNAFYDELYLWSFAYDLTTFGYFVTAGKDKVIVAGDVNGNTYKLDFNADTDNNVPIPAYFITKPFFFDAPYLTNSLTELHGFTLSGSEINILGAMDFSDDFQPLLTVSGLSESGRVDTSKLGMFKMLQFKVMWNGAGKRPEFYGIIPIVTQLLERNIGAGNG